MGLAVSIGSIMTLAKRILIGPHPIIRWTGRLLFLPGLYMLLALVLGIIPAPRGAVADIPTQTFYLATNGVHLDLVLPVAVQDHDLWTDLKRDTGTEYMSFGWGDQAFFVSTPQWTDMTLHTALGAVFLDRPTAMHVRKYRQSQKHWVAVRATEAQYQAILDYVSHSFDTDSGHKQIVPAPSYGPQDTFYSARGNYTLAGTCNTWINTGLKEANLPAAVWTPFDFGVLHWYID